LLARPTAGRRPFIPTPAQRKGNCAVPLGSRLSYEFTQVRGHPRWPSNSAQARSISASAAARCGTPRVRSRPRGGMQRPCPRHGRCRGLDLPAAPASTTTYAEPNCGRASCRILAVWIWRHEWSVSRIVVNSGGGPRKEAAPQQRDRSCARRGRLLRFRCPAPGPLR
jgi:hypothetical protein